MPDKPYNVLFISTGNSARSLMAEAILNKLGAGKFRAYSAGSHPKDEVNPHVLELLTRLNYDTSSLHPKSWSEFAGPNAPEFNFIFTVCDKAAGEESPVWSGSPVNGNWGIPDPAAVEGTPAQEGLAFDRAFGMLSRMISLLIALPVSQLDQATLQVKTREIGQSERTTATPPAAR